MANDVTGNPLNLDTAANNIVTGLVRITKIAWEPIAIDDQAVLKDGNGRIFYDKKIHQIGAANNTITPEVPDSDFVPPLLVKGISLTTLGTGNHVHIYYDGPTPVKTT